MLMISSCTASAPMALLFQRQQAPRLMHFQPAVQVFSPDLNALMVIPMFPHTLSARPITLDANKKIDWSLPPKTAKANVFHCDGQVHLPVMAGDEILIKKSKHKLNIIHPEEYSYYDVLRTKLNWGQKLF